MFDGLALADGVTLLRAGVDALLGGDLGGVPGPAVLAVLGAVETQVRRLAAVDHRLLAEVDSRQLAGELARRDTPIVLHQLVRVNAGEARRRVQAARDLGPRRSLTGEVLPPLCEPVALAVAAGAISAAHARVIVEWMDRLPAAVDAAYGEQLRVCLVEHAAELSPAQLARRHRPRRADQRPAAAAPGRRNRHHPGGVR